jgi:hypothetical protein
MRTTPKYEGKCILSNGGHSEGVFLLRGRQPLRLKTHWIRASWLLRRLFAFRGGACPPGAPATRPCCRSERRQEPARTQAPLAPSPFRGDLA